MRSCLGSYIMSRHYGRNLYVALMFGFIAQLFPTATLGAEQKPMIVGVIPNISARKIFTNYQPMREYLEGALKRKVEIATAADFITFSHNTHKGDYDLIVASPNMGRVSQKDFQWVPIAIYEPKLPALLVTLNSNAETSLNQIKGKALAVANPMSLVVLRGLAYLNENGLAVGKDFKLERAGNEDSLFAFVNSGAAPLAMMSMPEFKAISEKNRANLKIMKEFDQVLSFQFMVNPKMTEADRDKLKQLILKFPASDEGKKFFELTGFKGIREALENDLKALDPYLEQSRAALKPATK